MNNSPEFYIQEALKIINSDTSRPGMVERSLMHIGHSQRSKVFASLLKFGVEGVVCAEIDIDSTHNAIAHVHPQLFKHAVDLCMCKHGEIIDVMHFDTSNPDKTRLVHVEIDESGKANVGNPVVPNRKTLKEFTELAAFCLSK